MRTDFKLTKWWAVDKEFIATCKEYAIATSETVRSEEPTDPLWAEEGLAMTEIQTNWSSDENWIFWIDHIYSHKIQQNKYNTIQELHQD